MTAEATAPGATRRYDVLVVGAGFAGMYLIRKLRDELGLDVRVFERGDGVGGTWFWNRYPGARCDVESLFYSYSFDADLQRDWQWSERYPAQPEILAYAEHVADRFDLRPSIEFGTAVTAAEFDELENTWTVTTDTGDRASAPYLITAVGCLSAWQIPSFEGIESFAGEVHHTGDWPKEGVDFTGRRVAVIGTGSSGIQSIPVIARQAAHLTVFQRTAHYSIPARNRPLTEVEQRDTKAEYDVLRDLARQSRAGLVTDAALGAALETDPLVARTELERRWWRGGAGLTGIFTDTILSTEANEVVAEFVRGKVRSLVRDPRTAALLEPRDYPIGTKRLVIDSDYYATFNLPHVDLVSVRDTPIERISPRGVVVDGHEYECDAIVFATGFDAMTGSLNRIAIRGTGGQLLRDKWAAGPQSYLGLGVSGFPNMFMVTGPGSPSVLSNMIVSIEQHVDWIADYLGHLQRAGIVRTEASPEAERDWVEHVNDLAAGTLLPTAASWYMGANIPGKPRVYMPYCGGVGTYRDKCAQVAGDGYAGFVHHRARRGSGSTVENDGAVPASA
ncbi:flavin-containing monooxygenase [Pseudonocardia lacus]|uniref:flavin-containing monooxygenase n=1 Tax=Pseudonocardia lacus TaxID=2835865 RepID=UPI001BDC8400|nr:NAD(P)/FAD-dependent oxidoreductase [Pseudonocardia lacus]